MKIKVIYKNQPILDIDEDNFGLNRDRNPDSGWGELRRSSLTHNKTIEVDLNENRKLAIILIEDLAYAYGSDTKKFNKKLKEFGFIPSDDNLDYKKLTESTTILINNITNKDWFDWNEIDDKKMEDYLKQ
jgi:hypothetical protein